MIAPAQTEHVREADARQAAIYRAMTPRRRLEQALRMNAAMRRLLALGFAQRHPDWTDTQIRRAVADRILHARTG